MSFLNFVSVIGFLLLCLGLCSAAALFLKSIGAKSARLKEIDVANLWVIFPVGLVVGLPLTYFWF